MKRDWVQVLCDLVPDRIAAWIVNTCTAILDDMERPR